MKKLHLFHIADGRVARQSASLFRYERELQDLLEQYLHDFLGVHFLAREFATDSGYIDTLGIDDSGRPVIIEYKRSMNQAVVVQGLDYLDWLMDRRADFRLLVMEKLGSERAQRIDWSPRLLIIASDYTDRQLRAVRRIHGIELLCYRRYGEQDFALEWVHGGVEEPVSTYENEGIDDKIELTDFNRFKNWDRTNEEVKALFRELLAFAQTLGEMRLDVFATQFSFRRMKGAEASLEWPPVFAQATPNLSTGIRVYVLKRTQSVDQVEGLARPTTDHLIIHINNLADLERAKPLLRDAYERY
ncbi:MAG: endonuclease NucS [Anaerolineaceae bacterium]|nr:endonuclease NucS [Anaerolineaceae bacterium]